MTRQEKHQLKHYSQMLDDTDMRSIFQENLIQDDKNKYMKWFGTQKGELEVFGNCQ